MIKFYLILLGILRVIGGVIAGLQIVAIVLTINLLGKISFIESDMMFFFGIKVALLCVGLLLYQGLKKPYNRLKIKNRETAAPEIDL